VSDRKTLVVKIRGRELRILSDEDPIVLKRVAGYVDETMARIEKQTGTVDTRDVTMLASLNLAREALDAKDEAKTNVIPDDRLRSLIELAESALNNRA
jgi:cell division protein ZapA (FtsZ GTPase activity inhibitor)